MEELLDFLRALREHNDKTWFDAHRPLYQRVKRTADDFAQALIEGVGAFDESVRGLRVQDCTYRIYRDVRFSADKSPYKTHIGIYVAPRGKKSGYAGYYVHLEPSDGEGGGGMLASGLYLPEPVILRSVREEVLDNGGELVRAIARAEEAGFRLDDERTLRRTPKGFPPDTPHDALLRHRDFLVERPLTDDFIVRPDFLPRTLEALRTTHEFVQRINRAVQYAYEEMM